MTQTTRCGPLLVGGFAGESLPTDYARALRDGRRGGVILFAHNVRGGPAQVASIAREVRAAHPAAQVGIDQEGGRVARLRAPRLDVPPMRTVASWGDVALAERIAFAVGTELASLGITTNFAPVLDVNTCEHNPIIGDRAFGADAETVCQFGVAWIRGLQKAGVLATGKHYPGHGDTSVDSHLVLPRVGHPRERLERIELPPFRAAVASGVAALMTAHVVYPALDPEHPATLSRIICTDLRREIGFDGILFSDDLEMKAITHSPGESAVLAIAAGCDALLICHGSDAQDAAVEALDKEAEASPAFRARCESALSRIRAVQRRFPPLPIEPADARTLASSSRTAAEMAARAAGSSEARILAPTTATNKEK